MVKNYDVELDVITPVIINNGETYDFWEYIPIDEKPKIKNEEGIDLPIIRKVLFPSIETFLEKLKPSEMNMFISSVSDAVARNDNSVLLKKRNEILGKIDKDTTFKGRILPEAFKDLYNKPSLKVDKICTLPLSGATYIPGSSIKGSIRTAFLETLRAKKGLDHWKNVGNYNSNRQDFKGARNFEMEVINDSDRFKIEEDPFMYFKVSDFNFEKVDKVTYIGKVIADMPIYSAMTNSYIYGGRRVTAKGTISLDNRFFNGLKLKYIFSKVNDFYLGNYNDLVGKNSISTGLMRTAHNRILNEYNNEDVYVIRLGHYIGIQNYTFNVNQLNPPPKATKDINIKGGKTKTIEGGLIPGICLMRIVGEDK